MNTKLTLSHDDVAKMLEAATVEARKYDWRVTVAVCDDGGHLLGLLRLDDAPVMSASLAPAKAQTAALGARDSRVFEEMINGGRTAFLSAPNLPAMLEGGLAVIVKGQCLGGIGVSGAKSAENAQVARRGMEILANSGFEVPHRNPRPGVAP